MANEYDVQKKGIAKFLDYLCLTPLGAIGFLILIIFPLFPPFNQDYLLRWFILAAIMGAGSMAFDFSAGYIAVVNFGFAAFVGLGAYTSGIVAVRWGLPLPVAMLCGALTSALLGLFTGAISLRMRGMFAICLTWFIGIALMGLAIKMVWLTRGMLGLQVPYFFPSGVSNLYYWYPVLGLSLITWFILKRMARSHMGLAFKAIGQNMDAAKTSGINPTRYRIINFTVSCALAGWIGAFYAHFIGILTPDFMHTAKTVEFLVIAYIGGRGTLWGGFAVAFPFIWFTEMLRSNFDSLPGINLLIYGLMLILIMIFYAGGMAQFFQYLVDKYKDHPTIRWLTT
ncbi:MAG: branched-chain amino acid ABC transporter permease [Deltaproteobacteria bacterium]|jgi:branched-chain amino acid transport system permease protein|nr:branched-chain amino acid ABC transporter permease [Deltaproteobacteria bacterium]MBW2480941.1 branched-chain amino acid ABC transporter permease [Deltaproteobacteria bacterium]